MALARRGWQSCHYKRNQSFSNLNIPLQPHLITLGCTCQSAEELHAKFQRELKSLKTSNHLFFYSLLQLIFTQLPIFIKLFSALLVNDYFLTVLDLKKREREKETIGGYTYWLLGFIKGENFNGKITLQHAIDTEINQMKESMYHFDI